MAIGVLVAVMISVVVGVTLIPFIVGSTAELTGTSATTAALAAASNPSVTPIVGSPAGWLVFLTLLLGGLIVVWSWSKKHVDWT